jgi:serine/threonine protein kinase
VLRFLGKGTFGKVWLAEDLHLGRLVALKTLRLADTGGGLETRLAALQKEAGILARFSHPNIVQVHAWRPSGGEHYVVLQYVAGGSFDKRLEAGPLPWHLAARYIADVAHGLLVVHRHGIIHRDIKPANILWRCDQGCDEALLTDFGVSAYLSDPASIAGTPLYMAPEAFAGAVSPKQDVYSLAATLFHLATGDVPFRAPMTEVLRERIAAGLPAQDARCAGLPQRLEEVIRAGLDAEPGRWPRRRAKTGGRVKSSRTSRGVNRAALALRLAAQSLHHSQGALGGVLRRMKGRLGVQAALTATASVTDSWYRFVNIIRGRSPPGRLTGHSA